MASPFDVLRGPDDPKKKKNPKKKSPVYVDPSSSLPDLIATPDAPPTIGELTGGVDVSPAEVRAARSRLFGPTVEAPRAEVADATATEDPRAVHQRRVEGERQAALNEIARDPEYQERARAAGVLPGGPNPIHQTLAHAAGIETPADELLENGLPAPAPTGSERFQAAAIRGGALGPLSYLLGAGQVGRDFTPPEGSAELLQELGGEALGFMGVHAPLRGLERAVLSRAVGGEALARPAVRGALEGSLTGEAQILGRALSSDTPLQDIATESAFNIGLGATLGSAVEVAGSAAGRALRGGRKGTRSLRPEAEAEGIAQAVTVGRREVDEATRLDAEERAVTTPTQEEIDNQAVATPEAPEGVSGDRARPSVAAKLALDAATEESPINPNERMMGGALVDARPFGDNTLYVNSIRSTERGTGQGSAALDQLIGIADEQGVSLRLTPEAKGGLDQTELEKWYLRHGFRERGDGTWERPAGGKRPTLKLGKGTKTISFDDVADLPAPKTREEVLADAADDLGVAAPRQRDVIVSRLEVEANAARKRLSDPGTVRDVTQVVADYAIVGAYHVARGAVKLADFTEKMVAEFGEAVRPHIEDVYRRSVGRYRSLGPIVEDVRPTNPKTGKKTPLSYMEAARELVRGRRNLADADPELKREALTEALQDDLVDAASRHWDTRRWYRDDIAKMEATALKDMPELADEGAMVGFKAMLAIFSPSEKPIPNYRWARKAWKAWVEEGYFWNPKGVKWTASEVPVQKINERLSDLAQRHIVDGVDPREARKRALAELSEWMLGTTELKTSVPTLIKMAEIDKGAPLTEAEIAAIKAGPKTRTVYNAILPDSHPEKLFGQKTGAFFLNLNGISSVATMDMWATRTVRRVLGYLPDRTEIPSTQVREYEKKLGRALTDDEREALRTLDSTPTEEERAIFNRATDEIGKRAEIVLGTPLTRDEVQALLWFYEKDLFEQLTGGRYATFQTFSQGARVAAEDAARGRPLTPAEVRALSEKPHVNTSEEERIIDAELAAIEGRQSAASRSAGGAGAAAGRGASADAGTVPADRPTPGSRAREADANPSRAARPFRVDRARFRDPERSPLTTQRYAILTGSNPMAKTVDESVNQVNNARLLKELLEAGYEPIPVRGHYGQPEDSFLVPGMSTDEARRIGARYQQESVLTDQGLVYHDGTFRPHQDEVVVFDDAAEDFYSVIEVDGVPTKFTMQFDFSVPTVPFVERAALDHVRTPNGTIIYVPAGTPVRGGEVLATSISAMRVYDLAADPEGITFLAQKLGGPGERVAQTIQRLLRERGYDGYRGLYRDRWQQVESVVPFTAPAEGVSVDALMVELPPRLRKLASRLLDHHPRRTPTEGLVSRLDGELYRVLDGEFVGVEPGELRGVPRTANAQAGERLTAAAMRYPDGQTFTGMTHQGAHFEARKAGFSEVGEAGFVTSTGRFVTRAEAFEIAEASNQFVDKRLGALDMMERSRLAGSEGIDFRAPGQSYAIAVPALFAVAADQSEDPTQRDFLNGLAALSMLPLIAQYAGPDAGKRAAKAFERLAAKMREAAENGRPLREVLSTERQDIERAIGVKMNDAEWAFFMEDTGVGRMGEPVEGVPVTAEREGDRQLLNISKLALDPKGEKLVTERMESLAEQGLTSTTTVPRETMERLARLRGFTAEELSGKPGALDGAELLGLMDAIHTEAEEIGRISDALAEPGITSDEVTRITEILARREQRLDAMLLRFHEGRSEAGRALGALRYLARRVNSPTFWFAQAARAMGVKPTELSPKVRDDIKAIITTGRKPSEGDELIQEVVEETQAVPGRAPRKRKPQKAESDTPATGPQPTGDPQPARRSRTGKPASEGAARRAGRRNPLKAIEGLAKSEDKRAGKAFDEVARKRELGSRELRDEEVNLPMHTADLSSSTEQTVVTNYRLANNQKPQPTGKPPLTDQQRADRLIEKTVAGPQSRGTGPRLSKDEQAFERLPKATQVRLVQYVRSLQKSTTWDKFLSFWKAGLLTGPATHEANFISNVAFGVPLEAAKDVPAYILDRTFAAIGAIYDGARGQSVAESFVRRQTKDLGLHKWRAAGQGVLRGAKKGWFFLTTGVDEDEILRALEVKQVRYDTKVLDLYVNGVFRALGASDKVFKERAFGRSFAERLGLHVKRQGLRGKAWRAELARLMQNPDEIPEEITLAAIADAEFATFTDDNVVARGISSLKNQFRQSENDVVRILGTGLMELIVPFTRTPANVASALVDYSPLGVVTALGKATKAYKKGPQGEAQRQLVEGLARVSVGSSFIMLGYILRSQDKATAFYPRDQRERALWAEENRQENSVMVGGSWRNLGRVSPVGNLIALGAAIYDIGRTESSPAAKAGQVTFAGARSLLDQTFLKGTNAALQALEDEHYAKAFAANAAGSLVPAAVGAIARGVDPTVRETETIADRVRTRIPGMSSDLPERLTPLGRPVEREGGVAGQLFDPFRSRTPRSEDLVKELRRLEYGISGPSKSGEHGNTGEQRTPEEYRLFVKTAGERTRLLLADLMQKPQYQRADDEEKREMIDDVVRRSRTETKREERFGRPAYERRDNRVRERLQRAAAGR